MNATRDHTFLKMLQAVAPGGAAALGRLVDWWRDERRDGEEFAAALVRGGLLWPAAHRTLDLIEKGFLTAPDPSLVFTPEALALFQAPAPAPRSGPPASARIAFPSTRAAPPPRAPSNVMLLPNTPPKTSFEPPRPAPPLTVPEWPSSPRPAPPDTKWAPAPAPVTSAAAPQPARPRSGEDEPPPGLPRVGDVLGKCLITAPLGKGGHGVVFTALHQTLNIPVAVKVLLADGRRVDEGMRRQLRHEAQVLARLNHPNVTRVLDFDDGAIPYVVMEYVEGPSLADLIAQTGGLRPERAVEIFRHCARGLQAAWEHGIVHRDIKPGNVLLTRSGQAKLADLGLALTGAGGAARPAPGDANAAPVGTCAYMAPEQARTAHDVDFRADIYSLGATFYHTVTGRLPFNARSPRELLLKHATEAVVPPHALDPARVDVGTSDLIVRMMAKHPGDRFHSYDELLAALELVPSSVRPPPPVSATPPTPPAPATVPNSGLWNRFFTQRRLPE